MLHNYSVSQKSPWGYDFFIFFTNGWEFLIDFLHNYYAFLSSLDYKFYSIMSNFDEVMPY